MTQQRETVTSTKRFLAQAVARSLDSLAATYAAPLPPFAIAGLTLAFREFCPIVAHGRS